MATQLTRKDLRTLVSGPMPTVQVAPKTVIAAGVLLIAMTYASMIAAVYVAERDESVASERYANTRTLLEVPAISLDELQAQVDASSKALERARARLESGAVNAESDEATSLLVDAARDAGLNVRAITRTNPAQAKTELNSYTAHGVRLTVEGSTTQIMDYLRIVDDRHATLVPSISSLTLENNRATADIVFTVYTKNEPTPVAGRGQATPKASR